MGMVLFIIFRERSENSRAHVYVIEFIKVIKEKCCKASQLIGLVINRMKTTLNWLATVTDYSALSKLCAILIQSNGLQSIQNASSRRKSSDQPTLECTPICVCYDIMSKILQTLDMHNYNYISVPILGSNKNLF